SRPVVKANFETRLSRQRNKLSEEILLGLVPAEGCVIVSEAVIHLRHEVYETGCRPTRKVNPLLAIESLPFWVDVIGRAPIVHDAERGALNPGLGRIDRPL